MCEKSKVRPIHGLLVSYNTPFAIKPLNLDGGQCSWCGKYGHKRLVCPLLK
ncbi:hypothetical protein BY458DRAFT_433868 [Sporodiniella umbellata]|nr:hypothetical protein BY458DRAFT_433868 [Sporodiniella umbellata]